MKIPNTIIPCPTLREFKKVLQFLQDETDLKWISRTSPTRGVKQNWHIYKEKTILCIEDNRLSLDKYFPTLTPAQFIKKYKK